MGMSSEVASETEYKLAVISTHPIQYFAPFYRYLAGRTNICPIVFYCSKQGVTSYRDSGFADDIVWDRSLLDGYDYVFLENLVNSNDVSKFGTTFNPGVLTKIIGGDFDAILIYGYRYATAWLGILAGRVTRTPIFYQSEASLLYDKHVERPILTRWDKSMVLGILFSNVDRFLAFGSLNAQFYREYGVPDSRIVHAPYSVDNDFFREESQKMAEEAEEKRRSLGIEEDDVAFMFAAKFIPKKAPRLLLRAYARMDREDREKTALLMVGEGPIREELESLTRDLNLERVHFTGFVNQSRLPLYYKMADVFVRPDGLYKGDWGLTVNEAMACGLAIISTKKIAATHDLVEDGENGKHVTYQDVEDLARAMSELADDRELCKRMGARSLEIIDNWSYEESAQGFKKALESLH